MRGSILVILFTSLIYIGFSMKLNYSVDTLSVKRCPQLEDFSIHFIPTIKSLLSKQKITISKTQSNSVSDITIGVRFSEEYSDKLIKFPILSSNFAILRINDLKEAPDSVVTLKNSLAYKFANSLFPQVKSCENIQCLITTIKKKKADGIFGELCFLKNIASIIKQNETMKIDGKFYKFFYFIKLNTNNPKLKSELEKVMIDIYKKDLIQNMIERLNLKDIFSAPNHLKLAVINYPPYEFFSEGKWRGIDVEVVENVLKRFGYYINYAPYPPPRIFYYVRFRALDGVFSLEKNYEREKILYYVPEPLSRGMDVFVYRKDLKINNLKDFRNKTCSIVRGYSAEKYIESVCKNIIKVKDDLTGLRLVLYNRVDAHLINLIVNYYFKSKYRILWKLMNTEVVRSYESYLAFSKIEGLELIIDDISKEIKKFKSTLKYDKILWKYGLSRSLIWLH